MPLWELVFHDCVVTTWYWLLAGRRLWHRFRGQPDRADLDRPDPLDVALAHGDDDEPPSRGRHSDPPPRRPDPPARRPDPPARHPGPPAHQPDAPTRHPRPPTRR